MEYQIDVTFASSSSSLAFSISDCVGEQDWTCLNYWYVLSEYFSHMICVADTMLRDVFPEGHDFSLSNVNIKKIGDVKE